MLYRLRNRPEGERDGPHETLQHLFRASKDQWPKKKKMRKKPTKEQMLKRLTHLQGSENQKKKKEKKEVRELGRD